MRSDAIGMKGVLVVSAVLLAAFAILFTAHRYVSGGTAEQLDTQRMRAIYSAIYIYEVGHDDLPPPDLLTIRRDLGDDKVLQAENDPNVPDPKSVSRPGDKVDPYPYPLDPACPNLKRGSAVRISFSYLPLWSRYGGTKVKNWRKEGQDVKVGLLASYWYGSIDHENMDGRLCTGPVIRLNMDGSIYRLGHRSSPDALTADDLFFKR